MTEDTTDDIEGVDGEVIGGLTSNGDSPPDDSQGTASPGSDGETANGDGGSDVAQIPDPTDSGTETGDADAEPGSRDDAGGATGQAAVTTQRPDEFEAFVEVQHFRQRWLWASILGVSALAVVTVALRSPPLLVSAILLVVPAVGIPATYLANLRTEVREDGLYLRLTPFHLSFRHVPFEDVSDHEVRTFRAGRDFGGIGIRRTPSGWAYVVSGGEGVSVERGEDPAITIGSERADELERAITRGIARERAAVSEGTDAPKWQAVADISEDDDVE